VASNDVLENDVPCLSYVTEPQTLETNYCLQLSALCLCTEEEEAAYVHSQKYRYWKEKHWQVEPRYLFNANDKR